MKEEDYLDRSKLPDDVDLLKDIIIVLRQEIILLREELGVLKAKVFGHKSEKSQKKSLKPENKIANDNVKHPGRQKGNSEWLRERIVYDLPVAEKMCPHCQGFLSAIGEEVSQQLEWIRPSLKVLEHVRLKYSCKNCHQSIATAPTPYKPIEKGLAGPHLMAHVVVSKFLDHLPLYRQEKILNRYGLFLNRSTLCNWILATANSLEPIYDTLKKELLLGNHVYSDDTPLPTLSVKGRDQKNEGKSHKAYMWVYGRDGHHGQEPIVIYDYTLGRSGLYPQTFLKDFTGHIQADAYPGYDKVYSPDKEGNVVCIETGCWAHVRRKFVEALMVNKNSPAQEMVTFIKNLYDIERICKEQGLSVKAIYHKRQQEAKPILQQIHQWLMAYQPQVIPKGLLGKAIHYTVDNWHALTEFIHHGHLAIDNNFSERNMKLIVMGRKNYLFAGNAKGGKSAAILYSLIQTCALNGVNAEDYLADVLLRIQHHPHSKAQDLLPYNWKSLNFHHNKAA